MSTWVWPAISWKPPRPITNRVQKCLEEQDKPLDHKGPGSRWLSRCCFSTYLNIHEPHMLATKFQWPRVPPGYPGLALTLVTNHWVSGTLTFDLGNYWVSGTLISLAKHHWGHDQLVSPSQGISAGSIHCSFLSSGCGPGSLLCTGQSDLRDLLSIVSKLCLWKGEASLRTALLGC